MSDHPTEPRQVNFTIIPADTDESSPRTYANFCAIAHTPFDFTLTFCEVLPLSDRDIRDAELVRARRPAPRRKPVEEALRQAHG